MNTIICLLIIYSVIITNLFIHKREENDRNYSNYQNCLKALAEYDPKLSAYLRQRGEENGRN